MTPQIWEFRVECGKVREFARAVGDDHWQDEEPTAPPTFLTVATIPFIEKLIVDDLKLDRKRVVHGEQELEYFRPVAPGQRLVCRGRVAEDYVKPGRRGGAMRFIVVEVEFHDAANGELVAIERSTAIETAPPQGART